MIIHGLCVCVDYAEFLQVTGRAWMQGLTSLTVVTTSGDIATHKTCCLLESGPPKMADYWRTHFRVVKTDAFTRNGASFNKGLAMEEARKYMDWEDWILFFDVDVVPIGDSRLGVHWWEELHSYNLQMGYLYGAWRYQSQPPYGKVIEALKVPDDRVGYGYFQLFHSKDPKVQITPLLDTHWTHAGNYDSNFLLSFRSMTRELPLPLIHIGPQHENWYGKGQAEKFKQMQATRNGMGIHPSERVAGL